MMLFTAGEFGREVSGVAIGVASVLVVSAYISFCFILIAGMGGGGIDISPSSTLASLDGGVRSFAEELLGVAVALPNVFSKSRICAS